MVCMEDYFVPIVRTDEDASAVALIPGINSHSMAVFTAHSFLKVGRFNFVPRLRLPGGVQWY